MFSSVGNAREIFNNNYEFAFPHLGHELASVLKKRRLMHAAEVIYSCSEALIHLHVVGVSPPHFHPHCPPPPHVQIL